MADFFSFVEPKSKGVLKKVGEKDKVQPILYDEPDPTLVVLVDEVPDESTRKKLVGLITTENSSTRVRILYCLKHAHSPADLKGKASEIFREDSINFSEFIKPGTPVLAVGRAIYAVTKGNTDLRAESFYDFFFNKTYFYAPNIGSYIFPVDYLGAWFGKDNFEWFFALTQIKEATHFKPRSLRVPEIKVLYPEDPNAFLEEHSEACEVAWDIETSGLEYLRNQIGCLTLSFDGKTAYYLDWNRIDKKVLTRFLSNKYQIGANLKFDVRFLRHNGVPTARVDFDTLNAGHVLNEMRSNSLKTHSWLYTGYGGYEEELDKFKRDYPAVKNYLEIPRSILSQYAAKDAAVTFLVYKAMKKQLEDISNNKDVYPEGSEWTLSRYYYDIVIPALETYVCIELEGMTIDWDRLRETGKQLKVKILDLEAQIKAFFKVENIGSDVQLGNYIQNALGWKNHGQSKTGAYLVNEDTLKKWKADGHPEADLLIRYHTLDTLYSTFLGDEEQGTGYWQYRMPDGRVHSSFQVMLADSGRNKCGNPNLQNIPKRGEFAELIRQSFSTPGPDFLLGEFDGAGFQLRIGAAMSRDPEMLRVFTELGGDMHSMTAQYVFRPDLSLDEFLALKEKGDKAVKKHRFKAKGVNFGFEFGASGFSFASQLESEWSLQELEDFIRENSLSEKATYLRKKQDDMAKKGMSLSENFYKFWAAADFIRRRFFEKYKGLAQWVHDWPEEAAGRGYVVSSFGCIRRLPQLFYIGADSSQRDTKNLKNISLNSPVQGFEAALMMITMNKIHDYIVTNKLKSRLCGNVHDSIVLYIHKDEVMEIARVSKEAFGEWRAQFNGVPMELECEVSDYYGKNEVWGFGKQVA